MIEQVRDMVLDGGRMKVLEIAEAIGNSKNVQDVFCIKN